MFSICREDAETSDLPWVRAAVQRGDRWLALMRSSSQNNVFDRLAKRQNYDCVQRVDGPVLVSRLFFEILSMFFSEKYFSD